MGIFFGGQSRSVPPLLMGFVYGITVIGGVAMGRNTAECMIVLINEKRQ